VAEPIPLMEGGGGVIYGAKWINGEEKEGLIYETKVVSSCTQGGGEQELKKEKLSRGTYAFFHIGREKYTQKWEYSFSWTEPR